MDIISRYNVDGFALIGLVTPEGSWGYNLTAVNRFQRHFVRLDRPKPDDPNWCDFRREQVTAFVRKVYLSAIALKPQLKISAATIAWPPVPTTDVQWSRNAAPNNLMLQDWRAWMEEGILDMNIPMLYYRQTTPHYAESFAKWSKFAKDHRYNRHLVISPGGYENTISNTITQIRMTREPTAGGNRADGVCLYSYAIPTVENRTSRRIYRGPYATVPIRSKPCAGIRRFDSGSRHALEDQAGERASQRFRLRRRPDERLGRREHYADWPQKAQLDD